MLRVLTAKIDFGKNLYNDWFGMLNIQCCKLLKNPQNASPELKTFLCSIREIVEHNVIQNKYILFGIIHKKIYNNDYPGG